jgi:hypothetical protein
VNSQTTNVADGNCWQNRATENNCETVSKRLPEVEAREEIDEGCAGKAPVVTNSEDKILLQGSHSPPKDVTDLEVAVLPGAANFVRLAGPMQPSSSAATHALHGNKTTNMTFKFIQMHCHLWFKAETQQTASCSMHQMWRV